MALGHEVIRVSNAAHASTWRPNATTTARLHAALSLTISQSNGKHDVTIIAACWRHFEMRRTVQNES